MGSYIYASDFIKKRNAASVLDAACADGYGCIEMAQTGAAIHGLDYNAKLIKKAKSKSISLDNVDFTKTNLNEDDLSRFFRRRSRDVL